jgi:hypothetical protein
MLKNYGVISGVYNLEKLLEKVYLSDYSKLKKQRTLQRTKFLYA